MTDNIQFQEKKISKMLTILMPKFEFNFWLQMIEMELFLRYILTKTVKNSEILETLIIMMPMFGPCKDKYKLIN